MSLLDNQQYKKKIEFVKANEPEKRVTFIISISCNHDIDKTILNEIEEVVNEMFLENYEDSEVYEQRVKAAKALEKIVRAEERLKLKQQEKEEKERLKELSTAKPIVAIESISKKTIPIITSTSSHKKKKRHH